MPEYLAPGVYVEETSFRAKSIEGVGTSTTAFVGPTRRGPTTGTPEMVTSLPDFERIYGSLQDLGLSDVAAAADRLNFVAHAARAYFDNGGSRLYVVRTNNAGALASGQLRNGGGTATEDVFIRARFAGAAMPPSRNCPEASAPLFTVRTTYRREPPLSKYARAACATKLSRSVAAATSLSPRSCRLP